MAKLDKESYEKLVSAIEDAGHEVFGYVGRGMHGMHGSKCLAVECDGGPDFFLDLAVSLCENAEEPSEVLEILDALRGSRTDTMGHGSVVYWPSIEWAGEEGGEDEEDEIEVNTEEFRGAHGHNPAGGPDSEGEWVFCFGEAGEKCPDSWADRRPFTYYGTYGAAKRAAVAKAAELGKATVFVRG